MIWSHHTDNDPTPAMEENVAFISDSSGVIEPERHDR